jgi:hypothetical protein
MTPTELRALARILGTLLPWRTIGHVLNKPTDAHTLADRLEEACRAADIAVETSVIIADALVRYLYEGESRYESLEAYVGKGAAILNLAMGGQGDAERMAVPAGVELTDEAIAHLLSWALMEELDDSP